MKYGLKITEPGFTNYIAQKYGYERNVISDVYQINKDLAYGYNTNHMIDDPFSLYDDNLLRSLDKYGILIECFEIYQPPFRQIKDIPFFLAMSDYLLDYMRKYTVYNQPFTLAYGLDAERLSEKFYEHLRKDMKRTKYTTECFKDMPLRFYERLFGGANAATS